MKENFIKVMYPAFPSNTTHVVLEKTFYYDASGESIPPIGKNPKPSVENVIEAGEEITLIEYGLGYKNQWSKVLLINGEYAYILSSEIEINDKTKELYPGVKNIPGPLYPYNNSKDYLPDYSLNKINWRDQTPNIVFEDKYTGKLCVHYEYSEVTEVSGDEDLKQKIKEACYTGTRLILESKGIKISDKLLFDLVDNFYYFSRAEEYFFAVRNCSTLRILVTLPTRFLYATNILLSDDAVLNPEDSGENDNESGLGNLNNNSDAATPDSSTPETNDTIIVYSNKQELDIHFSTIAANLVSIFSLFTFPPSKSWIIEPKTTPSIIPGLGAINLLEHQQKIGDFHKEINEFIYNNLAEQAKLHNDGLENYKKVFSKKQLDKNDISNWFSITDLLTLKSTKSASYKGKVQLVIDNVNLVLKDIKFFTEDDKEIVLNVGKDNFLNKEIIKNKTCLNYICKIQPYTRLANEYEVWDEEYDTLALKLSNSDKLIKVIIDELFSVKTNRNESELRTFLLNNHYPTITSIKSVDLPLSFSCTDLKNTAITIEQYLNKIRISESPREKLRAYNQLVKDVQNSISIEGNNFNKYINNPSLIQNPNFKLLLGMAELSPDQEFAINEFIAAASTIDWPRYLQDSVKCAGIKFDPRTFTDILNEFDRARQLLEDCNPAFSVNLLNQLSNFSLPELPDYNPNLTLVEDLKNLVLKIIREALVFVIRKLIEDALKACMDAMASSGGTNPTSEDLFPDGENGEAPKANLNNLKNADEANALMKDFLGVDAGRNEGGVPNNDLDNAKALLQDVLADIIPCLSVREMCDLLSGRTLNNDIYDFISSLLNKKYNFKTGNINLALKLNSKEQIQIFFKKLGSAFNLNICSDLLDNLEGTGRIPSNPLCDDGSRKARQKEILENKGLSPEQIDNLINELQNQDEKNLRDILGFLNSPDTPFDLNNIPTVLCKKGPNGETIPPAVSLAPPMKMFGKVLDSVFKPVYDNFDSEAVEWYKNTYSTISSANKNHISFVGGKLVIKPVKGNPSGDEARQAPKDKLKLNYLFDASYNKIELKQNNIYNFTIDGYDEQKLETELASKDLRDKVIKDNISLYNYLDEIMSSYEEKLSSDESLKLSLQDASVQQFFSLAASFYASNMSVIKDNDRLTNLKKIINFNDNDIGNALYAESISLPIRDSIVQMLENQQVKTFLNKIYTGSLVYTKETFGIKEYALGLGANNLYSNFDIDLQVNDKIDTSGKLINDYSLIIKKNGINFIDATDTREIDQSLLQYLNTFNAGDVNKLSKQQIFNRFIDKKKQEFGTNYLSESLRKVKTKDLTGDFVSTNIGTANYEAFSKLTIKEMSDEIISSPFSKAVKLTIETDSQSGEFKDPGDAFLKPPDLSNPEQRESSAPMTQYMTLVIPQTPVQKACNIRPHYLDIDQIKEDLFKNKEEAFCIEEIKNEKILQGKEVDTQELANSQPTDTQSILLDGGFRLTLRVYLHDLMLRAISVFGIYDPQSLRNDDIFHTFMTEMVEAEMRSRDNTVFNMMNSYYSRQGLSIKDIVIQELKTNVLPKMAKRINEDTNEKLAALNPPQKINLRDADAFQYNKNSKLIKIDPITKSVYVRVNGTKILQTTFTNQKSVITLQTYKNQNLDFLNKYEELIFYQKIFTSNTTATQEQQIVADIMNDFSKSNEFKLLFDFLIPRKEILTFLFISNALCNSSNKKRRDSFEMTKANIQNSLKFMATSGAPIKPNPNNYQDMKNSDTSFMFIKFILMAAISAPISIVKGYTELTEPNISLSANVYRLAKAMIPETPSLIIPAMSLPLGIPIPPVFPLGIIPWLNIPLCLFYLLTGIWMDFSGNDKTEKDKKTSKDLLNKLSKGIVVETENADCSTVFNPDVVKLSPDKNGELIYDVKKPSSEFITATAATTVEDNEKAVIKDYQIKQIIKKAEKFSTDQIKQYFVQLPDNKGFDQSKISQFKTILNSIDADLINDLFESGNDLEKNLKTIIDAKTAPAKKNENTKIVTEKIKDLAKGSNIITEQILNNNINKQMKDMAKELAKNGNILANQIVNQNVNIQTKDIIKDVIKDLPKEVVMSLPKDIIKDLPKQTVKEAGKEVKKQLKEEKTIKPGPANKKLNPRKP